ncbi:hypothetical protein GW17_00015969 [Ensete ventricosum]|nr:hypothetical protein GW17_00015969 [Ensete ventricosum]
MAEARSTDSEIKSSLQKDATLRWCVGVLRNDDGGSQDTKRARAAPNGVGEGRVGSGSQTVPTQWYPNGVVAFEPPRNVTTRGIEIWCCVVCMPTPSGPASDAELRDDHTATSSARKIGDLGLLVLISHYPLFSNRATITRLPWLLPPLGDDTRLLVLLLWWLLVGYRGLCDTIDSTHFHSRCITSLSTRSTDSPKQQALSPLAVASIGEASFTVVLHPIRLKRSLPQTSPFSSASRWASLLSIYASVGTPLQSPSHQHSFQQCISHQQLKSGSSRHATSAEAIMHQHHHRPDQHFPWYYYTSRCH